MNKPKTLSLIIATTLSMSLALPVLADSERVKYGKTGNVYQRIDTFLAWTDAKSACEEEGGYLATITTNAENNFVLNKLLADASSYTMYKFGLTDEKVEGTWKWVVNESYRFNNWYPGQPNGGDYAAISQSDGQWHDVDNDYSSGYICEWSAKQIISNAVVPDLNGNGYDEWAILYVNSFSRKPYVRIQDGDTGKMIQLMEIGSTGDNPAAITSFDDISGNDEPEIAVAYSDGNNYWVSVHDAKTGDRVEKHYVLNAKKYDVISLSASNDSDGNGAPELIMQQETIVSIYNPSLIQTMDAKSGTVLREVEFQLR